METFKAKTFDIPELTGISKKNIEEHIKLYEGYVKNANSILERIPDYMQWAEKDPFVTYFTSELQRRFAFEFDGMRNHEFYFTSLEGGPAEITKDGALHKGLEKRFGSFDTFLSQFKALALTRGIGWAMLYYDKKTDTFLTQWVEEQHLGHLTGLSPILALDMWEHAYVYDYPTSEKKKYVGAFFENLNWKMIEQNYEEALG